MSQYKNSLVGCSAYILHAHTGCKQAKNNGHKKMKEMLTTDSAKLVG